MASVLSYKGLCSPKGGEILSNVPQEAGHGQQGTETPEQVQGREEVQEHRTSSGRDALCYLRGRLCPSYNCLQSFEINPWVAKASLLKYDFFFSSQALNFLCHKLPLTLFTLYVWYRFHFLLNSHFLFAYIFQDLNQSCCQNSLFVSSTYQHLSLEMFKAPVL